MSPKDPARARYVAQRASLFCLTQRRAANLAKKERREKREREAALLAGLRAVGATWFDEMKWNAENERKAAQERDHASVTTPDGAGESATNFTGAGQLTSTVLDLMDQRYIMTSSGSRGAMQVDRDLKILEKRVADFADQHVFLKHILVNSTQ